jgi:hypothetical protein
MHYKTLRILWMLAGVLLVALMALALIFNGLLPDLFKQYSTRNFKTASGKIIESQMVRLKSSKGVASRRYQVILSYKYRVGQLEYKGWRFHYTEYLQNLSEAAAQKIIATYPAGKSIVVYYSTEQPFDAVLVQGYGVEEFMVISQVMLPLGLFLSFGVIIWQRLREVFNFPAGGVKLVRKGRSTHVRLSGALPLVVAFGSWSITFAIIDSFTRDSVAFVAFRVFSLGICTVISSAVYWCMRRDMIIHQHSLTIDLPKSFLCKDPTRLSFSDISDVTIQEEMDGKYRRFIPTIKTRGSSTNFKLASWQNREKAVAFTAWLRRAIHSDPSASFYR